MKKTPSDKISFPPYNSNSTRNVDYFYNNFSLPEEIKQNKDYKNIAKKILNIAGKLAIGTMGTTGLLFLCAILYAFFFYEPQPLHIGKSFLTDSAKSELVDTLSSHENESQYYLTAAAATKDREAIKDSLISLLSDYHYDYSKLQNTTGDEIDSMSNMLTENIIPLLPELSYSDFEGLLFAKEFDIYTRFSDEYNFTDRVLTLSSRSKILDIMNSKLFQEALIDSYQEFSFNRMYSLALAMEEGLPWDISISEIPEDELNETIHRYIKQVETFEKTVMISKDMNICTLSTTEFASSKNAFVDRYLKIGGSPEKIITNVLADSTYAGNEDEKKAEFLDGISKCKTGPALILPITHGYKDDIDGRESSIFLNRGPDSAIDISPQELADAMINSGNQLSNFRIILFQCYGYNFAIDLLYYLREKGFTDAPIIFTANNSDKISWRNHNRYPMFFEEKNLYGKTELLGKDFFNLENQPRISRPNDPAFFVPMPIGKPSLLDNIEYKHLEISQNKPKEDDITLIEI